MAQNLINAYNILKAGNASEKIDEISPTMGFVLCKNLLYFYGSGTWEFQTSELTLGRERKMYLKCSLKP